MAGEFDLIRRHFAPLAGPAGLSLLDDVAWLAEAGLVITKDCLIDGVHFRASDGLGFAAQKALRVNISDCVAKGARPFGYLLGLMVPDGWGEAALAEIAAGLKADQDRYSLSLLGGDTTKHQRSDHPLSFSVTMLARPLGNGPVLRAGARAGDEVWVTGVLGAAAVGFSRLQKGATPDASEADIAAYLTPEPPVALAGLIARYASAAADISDGLPADAGHIARASAVSMDIHVDAVPVFGDERGPDARLTLITWGDDYQTVFTAPQSARENILAEADRIGHPVTRFGQVTDDPLFRVRLLDAEGGELDAPTSGHDHFGG